jgi:lipocalin
MTVRVHPSSLRFSSSSRRFGSLPLGASVLAFATLLVSSQLALAQPALPKLVPDGTVGRSNVGYSVALSATGDTAIVGGWGDNSYVGAVWVFTRSRSGVWSQQGSKLLSTDAVGPAYQGYSVALSADGNTAIVAGANDDSGVGAVWVFTRSGDTWSQQGSKLIAADAAGHAHQGYSVSLSNDGNTALVGGAFDAGNTGAVWVWTRSGDTWTPSGKLVGTGAVGLAEQGTSVALSRDGTTAIVGGPHDNYGVGAAWVFTRNGDAWTQQGSKLIGSDADGQAGQGSSVALSRDGNTAIVGGYRDRDFVGAAWIYTRSGGVWTQQGNKLVGPAVGRAYQGFSVSMSGDGNPAIVGGPSDNDLVGAAWVYVRRAGAWYLLGRKLVGAGAAGPSGQGTAVALSAGGDTAILGGRLDRGGVGAAWVFAATSPAPSGR